MGSSAMTTMSGRSRSARAVVSDLCTGYSVVIPVDAMKTTRPENKPTHPTAGNVEIWIRAYLSAVDGLDVLRSRFGGLKRWTF
jgi:hypothetical protein